MIITGIYRAELKLAQGHCSKVLTTIELTTTMNCSDSATAGIHMYTHIHI